MLHVTSTRKKINEYVSEEECSCYFLLPLETNQAHCYTNLTEQHTNVDAPVTFEPAASLYMIVSFSVRGFMVRFPE